MSAEAEANALIASVGVFDAHVDTDLQQRLLCRSPARAATPGRWRPFFGHTDWPRFRAAGFHGVGYDLATNPARTPSARVGLLRAHLDRIGAAAAHSPDVAVVCTVAGMDAARSAGRVALWPAVQGGNAFEADPDVLDGPLGDRLHRITLVHLTSSTIGGSNSPWATDAGLGPTGRRVVENCVRRGVLVDLAHAGRRTFDDAVAQLAGAAPPVVTHTGAAGVRPLWRNLKDEQIRAVADRGGFVGVIAHSGFLVAGPRLATVHDFVRHAEHVVNVGGEDCVAIGTDYDGFILPPWDLPDCSAMPTLVAALLARGWPVERVGKMLIGNVRRVLVSVRP